MNLLLKAMSPIRNSMRDHIATRDDAVATSLLFFLAPNPFDQNSLLKVRSWY